MKILIVSHHFAPHVSGVGHVAEQQAKSLTNNGNDVTVLTSDCSAKAGKFERDGYKLLRIRASNIMETHFGAPFPFFSLRLIWEAYRMVKNADVVHIHDVLYTSSIVSATWAKLLHKPIFITQHVAVVNHSNWFIMAVQKMIYQSIGKLMFRQSRTVVVYNANVKQFLVSLGIVESKIFQRIIGIDTEFFFPTTKKGKRQLKRTYKLPLNKPVVLFVGRLVPKKGFNLVFDARSDTYTTVIVGGGSVPRHMQRAKNVIFFGSASHSQLQDLYQLSDLFVFPAIGEIFTLVMQEAMACGVPIITTYDKAYDQYSLSRKLFCFAERNARMIHDKVSEILHDEQLSQRMAAYSRQFACENFSWQKNYPKELAIYQNLS